jgi:hypothetical protein
MEVERYLQPEKMPSQRTVPPADIWVMYPVVRGITGSP